MMATVDPGEEVVIFEPFYENYAPDAILSDATPRYVPLRPPDWSFRSGRVALNIQLKDPSDHYLQSQQPDRQGFHAR